MQKLTLTLTGIAPLLLHSDRGANPIDPATVAHKALTSKRKKTDDDHLAIARSEYLMAFYAGPGLVLPTTNVKSAIVEGAKLNKLGASFNRSLLILADTTPLRHPGPTDPVALWNAGNQYVDCRSVKVGTARLMRYRPRLSDWSLEVVIDFFENMIEAGQIVAAAENAGTFIGLGDYRPARGGPFGRFTVEAR